MPPVPTVDLTGMATDTNAQAKANKEFSEHTSSSIVQVTVGSGLSRRVYNLHKSILVDKSGYFRSCFNANLAEAHTGQVSLSEDEPRDFDCFVTWAYTGRVPRDMSIHDCITAYILADRLLCARALLTEIVAAFYRAAEKSSITLQHVAVIVDSRLTDSELMDAAIVELASAVSKGGGGDDDNDVEWAARFEKDETWHKILAADAGLTLRVLSALRSSWTRAAAAGSSGAVVGAAGSRGGAKKRKHRGGLGAMGDLLKIPGVDF